MLNRLADVLTVLVGLAAVATAGVVVKAEVERSQNATRPRVSEVKDWEQYAQSPNVAGVADAPVTIVEFGDYQCPFCQRFSEYVDSLAVLGRPVRLVYRHFPGFGHPEALNAAIASECAAEQGRFAAMHDELVRSMDSIGRVEWSWFARIAAVSDIEEFSRCVERTTPFATIAADTTAGRELRIQGTPTVLIQSLRYDGIPPFDSLLKWVDGFARGKPNEN